MKKHFIGIDISKKTLDISIYYRDQSQPGNYLKVTNDLPGFKSFTKWLKSKKLNFNDTVVCLEHTGTYGLDVCLFLESVNIDYSLVSGLVIRHSLGLQRGKSDKIDSYRISRYCYLYRDELTYYKIPSANLLRLRKLMAERRNYVKRSAQCKAYLTERKNKAVDTSVSRTTQELHLLDSFIDDIENEILSLIKSDSALSQNYDLLTSVVGIALVNAANALLYTNNFTVTVNARSYACYCGVAPFGYQSGTSVKRAPKVSKMANRQLKVDLSQGAVAAVRFDPELKLYFERKIASGKDTGNAYNAVKFKLIERMFAVIKRGSPYVKLSGYAAPQKQVV